MKAYISGVCEKIGPRMSTSENERRAAEDLRKRLDRYCDRVDVEEFSCAPGALLGHIKLIVFLYIIGVALCFVKFSWVVPVVGGALSASVLVIFYLELFRLHEVVDALFPTRRSQNVVGRIGPEGGGARRLIIFSGHLDSAYEFPLVHAHKTLLLVLIVNTLACTIYTAVVGVLKGVALALGWWLVQPLAFGGGVSLLDLLLIYSIVGAVSGVVVAFGLTSKRESPGASDNLSGVATTLALARSFDRHPGSVPDDTALWFVGFGCEECMRGSKRFVAAHREAFARDFDDVILINIDGVGAGDLYIVAEEKMYTSRHSDEVCALLEDAASAAGVDASKKILTLGGTDAAFFSKAGIKASSIVCIGKSGLPPYWHTLDDVPEYVDEKHLEWTVAICREALQRIADRRL